MKARTRHNLGKASSLREAGGASGASGASQLFLVRLWPDEADSAEWRGKVQHVMSGKASDFCDWPMLVAHLQAMLPHGHEGQSQDDAGDKGEIAQESP
ncbi:MAG TPA: hypothetical protein VJ183_10430 [Chloroflexia bacterium]|nr:hypothetical protein [Chloroflexia bacterium]